MSKVIDSFTINEYSILTLDKPITDHTYTKYIINNKEYDIVPIYDATNCIAIKSNENFIGKIISVK